MKGTYVFTTKSPLVHTHITLFNAGIYTTIEEVPNIFNLREAVMEALGMTFEEDEEDTVEDTGSFNQ